MSKKQKVAEVIQITTGHLIYTLLVYRKKPTEIEAPNQTDGGKNSTNNKKFSLSDSQK